MTDSLFVREGSTVVPTALTTSPWSDDALHGGPVAAVLARALEDVATTEAMFPARFTLELLRPVTLGPMRIDTRVVRAGRKVQVLEASLITADGPEADDPARGSGTLVARASLQQIRRAAVDLPDGLPGVNGEDPAVPAPELLPIRDGGVLGEGVRFHSQAVEHRCADRFFVDPGPALDWIRVVVDLYPDEPLSPFQRVVAAADFGNGVSSVLPFSDYLFVNPDLTVYLFRLPVDEWVCLDAVTRLDPSSGAGGVGLAESALFDREGRIGRSVQSLLVERLR